MGSKVFNDPIHRLIELYPLLVKIIDTPEFQRIRNIRYNRQVFNDPIHGLIELHPLLVKIIDTPEFQRLRNIKQLGMCYSVYPGASHNRFEHSIGVSFLAGRLVKELKTKDDNAELDITDEDVLCVQIAGLCHDLGHGPLSHVFDKMYVKRVLKELEDAKSAQMKKEPGSSKSRGSAGSRPSKKGSSPSSMGKTASTSSRKESGAMEEDDEKRKNFMEHEGRSRLIFEHLIKKNKLRKYFREYNVENDIDFIGELITAGDRGTEQIVANERNGIDVDKWDYFARDCHMLGIKNDFDHNRCIHVARVIEVEGRRQICYRDKEVYNLYEMFHTRFNLHVRAYQHHTNHIIQNEAAEVFWEARNDKNVTFNGKTLSDIIRTADIEAFCLLTDDFFSEIWNRGNREAKTCLEKVYQRKQPKRVSEVSLTASQTTTMGSCDDLKREIVEYTDVKDEEIRVLTVGLNYGKKDKNPMDYVHFYKKSNPDQAFKINKDRVSRLLPSEFSETKLRVYCSKQEVFERIKRRVTSWCDKKGYQTPN